MRRSLFAFIALFLLIPHRTQETPGRPKILGISYIKFKVTDLGKAQAFYGDTLGLASIDMSCRGLADACFAINANQHIELVTTAGSPGSFLVEIGMRTDDLVKMRNYLTARGVPAGKIIPGANHSSYFKTQDSEGNNIAFVQPGQDPVVIVNPKAPSSVLIHAGFLVKDSKAENRFYQDLLSCHLYWHGGMKDDKDDWVDMQVPDGTDWVEYMLNVPADANRHTLGVVNHIALGVPDIKTARERLIHNGWAKEDPQVGRDGKWQLNLHDPDDTRVEFMEFTPTDKPCCSDYTGPHPKP